MNDEMKPSPNPNEKLVRVFDAERESEVMVVQGLLESAGIDCDLTALDAVQNVLPGVGGTIILVREEDAEEALEVIQSYRELTAEDIDDDSAVNEDAPPEE